MGAYDPTAWGVEFLSTLSLRRATASAPQYRTAYGISIHALLAESDSLRTPRHSWCSNFYPRSPCGERQDDAAAQAQAKKFLSTLSLRRATGFEVDGLLRVHISIHALLAESDASIDTQFCYIAISIHALLAESDAAKKPQPFMCPGFLSTLSLRRATQQTAAGNQTTAISIHALLAESDRRQTDRVQHNRDFYPRSPCGERLGGLYGY